MTKSIEERADENYKSIPWQFVNNQSFQSVHNNAFLAGAKARDAQWLEVVSELREALDNIMTASQKSEESHALNVYYTAHDTLANTDQMLKEMNINKGE